MPELQNNYSEFFTVDEGYYPEINPDSIKGDIDGWMKTWPGLSLFTHRQEPPFDFFTGV